MRNLNLKNFTELNYNAVNNLRSSTMAEEHPSYRATQAGIQSLRYTCPANQIAGSDDCNFFFSFQDFWLLAEDKKLQVEKNQTGKRENI